MNKIKMQILKIISRNRRDFWVDFQCERRYGKTIKKQ